MEKNQYALSVIGKPWVNRESDCWWLVKDYYHKVLGFTLKEVKGYESGEGFEKLWKENINKQWKEVKSYRENAMITFYNASGEPKHVGICIGGMEVLHCMGTPEKGGAVHIHNLNALLRIFKKATFHISREF